MSDELKKAAEMAREEALANEAASNSTAAPTDDTEVATTSEARKASDDDDDEVSVDYGFDTASPVIDTPHKSATVANDTESEGSANETSESATPQATTEAVKSTETPAPAKSLNMELSDEDLMAYLPTDNKGGFETFGPELKKELNAYTKELITTFGMSPEEAIQARDNRARKRIIEEQKKYFEVNPDMAIVHVKKEDSDKLEFTDEEKEKLTRSKKIHLLEVEDVELKTIPIQIAPNKDKFTILNGIRGIYSQDSTPLPAMCDYATFRSIQINQLLEAVKRDDDRPEETLARQAAMIYQCFVRSTRLQKFNEKNEIVMSFDTFLETFAYLDVRMALYSILCASSKEETTITLVCPNCHRSFNKEYNVRDVLKLDHLTDMWKKRIDDILEYRNNLEYLNGLKDKLVDGIRVKSPLSQNIYDLQTPSIAKALNVLQYVPNEDNQSEMTKKLIPILMFINSMYVYNPDTQSYIEIAATEHQLLWQWGNTIAQDDIDMIAIMCGEYIYNPRFATEATCNIDEKCHYISVADFEIDDWIFSRGRDIPDVIAP